MILRMDNYKVCRATILIVVTLLFAKGCGISSVDTVDVAEISRWNIPTSTAKQLNRTPNTQTSKEGVYSYVVHGKRYWVKPVSIGYRESGVASWYGKKFHGRLTANQEVYNMYKLTAAHKSLPLPSYIKVYNHDNQRSVTVRVNDRGPFVKGRIVDLSYAAAKQIGIDKRGIAQVTIEVIDTPAKPERTTLKVANLSNSSRGAYIQIGAYSNIKNAFTVMRSLKKHKLAPRLVPAGHGAVKNVRVRLGPFNNSKELNRIDKLLERHGFKEYRILYK